MTPTAFLFATVVFRRVFAEYRRAGIPAARAQDLAFIAAMSAGDAMDVVSDQDPEGIEDWLRLEEAWVA